MTICNTVNNFYAQNTNFGQALLYGAFGTLTGGLGCLGGGYGMGGYGMGGFGMNGSLFSMIGMGGFGMGCIPNSMIGIQAGYSAANILIAGACQALESRSSAKAEAKAKIDTAKNNYKILTKNKEKLENENKGLKKPIKDDGTVTSEAKATCKTESNSYIAAKSALDNFINTTKLADMTNATIEGIKAKINQYYNDDGTVKVVDNKPMDTSAVGTYQKLKQDLADAQQAEYDAKKKPYDEKVNEAKVALETAATAKYNANLEEIKKIEEDAADAKKIIDDAAEEERTKFNNKNAKIEAKCDAEENEVENQSNTKKAFNQEYETFKKAQTKENFNKLKEAYNKITGNKKSFRKLMEAILKQHPDFDKTNIDW